MANFQVIDTVGVIEVDNPPVNALRYEYNPELNEVFIVVPYFHPVHYCSTGTSEVCHLHFMAILNSLSCELSAYMYRVAERSYSIYLNVNIAYP